MKTQTLEPTDEAIAHAVSLLVDAQVVAFPTETVYGLGARADSDAAIERIYQAKGRPAHKPLIVHVRDAAQARRLALRWDDRAQALAVRYWPGPLTLVVAGNSSVTPRVTAGGDSVALRAPAHPVARRLLIAAGFPLAAPSANRSGAPPPTTGAQVLAQLDGRIPLLLDAGRTPLGHASTIVDLTAPAGPLRVVRRGAIAATEIEAFLRQRGAPSA